MPGLKGTHTPRKARSCIPVLRACQYGPSACSGRKLQISALQAPRRRTAHWVSVFVVRVCVRQVAARLWPAGCSAAGASAAGYHANWRCCRGACHLEPRVQPAAAVHWPCFLAAELCLQTLLAVQMAGCTTGRVSVVCTSNCQIAVLLPVLTLCLSTAGKRRMPPRTASTMTNWSVSAGFCILLPLLHAAALGRSALASSRGVIPTACSATMIARSADLLYNCAAGGCLSCLLVPCIDADCAMSCAVLGAALPTVCPPGSL